MPSRSPSPRPPSLSSRVHDYKYHPAIRWLTRHTTHLSIGLLMVIFALLTVQNAFSTASRWAREPSLGAVATENKICSKIGTDLLEAGGSAADAMVGAMFCVGVIGMYHSGIGGGGFALVRDKEGRYESVDFREAAPAAAYQDMYEGNVNGSVESGLASGVPGELRGLQYLHAKYGRLSWPTLLIPSIRLARDGFTVTHDLVRYMEFTVTYGHDDFLTSNPSWAMDFAPNGTLVKLGDTLTRKRYADTLQIIAEEGPDVFYTGRMAQDTIEAIRLANGTMTLEDLASYEVISRPAVSIDYRGYKLYSCGAPASGAVALSALKTIEGYPDFGSPQSFNLSTHRLDEALRYAYASRGELGDPTFIPTTPSWETSMLSPHSASLRRGNISDQTTRPAKAYAPGNGTVLHLATPGHGTSHLVTADSSGLALSLTSTINLIFGSKLLVPTTGVILNNQMNDFSIPGRHNAFAYPPSPANFIRAGKRPLSSLTPTIVEYGNGSLYYVVGAAGGSRIISATVQCLVGVLDAGVGVAEGLARPRLHDQLVPDVVGFEWGMEGGNRTEGKDPVREDPPGEGEGEGRMSGRGERFEEGESFEKNGISDKSETSNEDQTSDQLQSILLNGPANGPPASQIGVQKAESGIGTGSIEGFDNRTVAFMRARGHRVEFVPPGFSSAQALRLNWNGTFEAAGEPRQADSGGFAV